MLVPDANGYNKQVRFTPNAGYVGITTFKYRAGDCNGMSNEVTVSVSIAAILQCANTVSLAVGACSASGASVVTNAAQLPVGTTIILSPSTPFAIGSHLVTASATVNGVAAIPCSATLTVVGTPPTATADAASTVAGQAVTLAVLANDISNGPNTPSPGSLEVRRASWWL